MKIATFIVQLCADLWGAAARKKGNDEQGGEREVIMQLPGLEQRGGKETTRTDLTTTAVQAPLSAFQKRTVQSSLSVTRTLKSGVREPRGLVISVTASFFSTSAEMKRTERTLEELCDTDVAVCTSGRDSGCDSSVSNEHCGTCGWITGLSQYSASCRPLDDENATIDPRPPHGPSKAVKMHCCKNVRLRGV